MLSDTLMLCKLIILNILNRVAFPLSNNQLSEFILENEYTGYLNFQQVITQLLEDSYIEEKTLGRVTMYSLTPHGKDTVRMFSNNISAAILNDIDAYLNKNRYTLHDELSYPADYSKNPTGDYSLSLYIIENNVTIFELHLNVPDELKAINMCNSWREKSSDIYAYAIKQLTEQSPAQ